MIKSVLAAIRHNEERHRLIEKFRGRVGTRLVKIAVVKVVSVTLRFEHDIGVAARKIQPIVAPRFSGVSHQRVLGLIVETVWLRKAVRRGEVGQYQLVGGVLL